MPFLVIVEIHGWGDASLAKFQGQPYEPRVGTVFELPAGELRVGRGTENDLVLPYTSVSRFHLRLFREWDQYIYEDILSQQIPIYNGKPLLSETRRAMKDGDTFNAAGILFRYLESVPKDLAGEG